MFKTGLKRGFRSPAQDLLGTANVEHDGRNVELSRRHPGDVSASPYDAHTHRQKIEKFRADSAPYVHHEQSPPTPSVRGFDRPETRLGDISRVDVVADDGAVSPNLNYLTPSDRCQKHRRSTLS